MGKKREEERTHESLHARRALMPVGRLTYSKPPQATPAADRPICAYYVLRNTALVSDSLLLRRPYFRSSGATSIAVTESCSSFALPQKFILPCVHKIIIKNKKEGDDVANWVKAQTTAASQA